MSNFNQYTPKLLVWLTHLVLTRNEDVFKNSEGILGKYLPSLMLHLLEWNLVSFKNIMNVAGSSPRLLLSMMKIKQMSSTNFWQSNGIKLCLYQHSSMVNWSDEGSTAKLFTLNSNHFKAVHWRYTFPEHPRAAKGNVCHSSRKLGGREYYGVWESQMMIPLLKNLHLN